MAHIRRLKSGLWQATVRHPSGERFSKSDPLKKVMQTWAADQEAKIRRGEWVNPHAGKMTLAAWRDKWLETRRVELVTKQRTDGWWRNHIEPKFGKWPIASIQSWDVEAWVVDLEARGVGLPTVNGALRLLGQILRAAVKHKLLEADPTSDVSATPPPAHIDRILTRDEAATLLEQFSDKDRLFVKMLLYCGLRWQEAAGLRRFRVDLLRKRIQIAKVLPRKGEEKKPKTAAGVRQVLLTDELVLELSQAIPAPDDGLVFTNSGRRLRYEHWHTGIWSPALRRAKLPDPQPTPHDLRHTFGSWLAEAGVPASQIAALMGHKTLRSTERYIHATEARFDQARAALERQGKEPQAYPAIPK